MWQADFMPEYAKFLDSLPAKIQRQIKGSVKDICNEPYRGNEQIQGYEFIGKLKRTSGDYRIVFIICKDCLETGNNVIYLCPGCGPHRKDWIKFFDVGYRGKYYAKAKRKSTIKTRAKSKMKQVHKTLTEFPSKTAAEKAKRKETRKRKSGRKKK